MRQNHLKKLKKIFIFELSKYIKKGSVVNCEFDLTKFESVATAAENKNKFIDFFIDMFQELIGKKGTLIVPGFTYSWGKDKKKKLFNLEKTKPKVGILPEYLMKKSFVARTSDPMFSFFILGNNKKYFTNISNDTFGKNSVYCKVLKKKGILVSFGLDRFDPTFVHYVEQYFDQKYSKLNYRYLKKISGTIISKKKKKKEFYYTFLKKKDSRYIYSEKKIKNILIKNKKIITSKILGSNIFIVKSVDFFKAGIFHLKKDKKLFVKKYVE
jgi:aminoglycoside 3-N-acetyltransferase